MAADGNELLEVSTGLDFLCRYNMRITPVVKPGISHTLPDFTLSSRMVVDHDAYDIQLVFFDHTHKLTQVSLYVSYI